MVIKHVKTRQKVVAVIQTLKIQVSATFLSVRQAFQLNVRMVYV